MKSRRRPARARGACRATGNRAARPGFPGSGIPLCWERSGRSGETRPCGRFRRSGSPPCSSSPRPLPPGAAETPLPRPAAPARGTSAADAALDPAARGRSLRHAPHHRGEPRRAARRRRRATSRRPSPCSTRCSPRIPGSACCRPTAPCSPCSPATPRRRAPACCAPAETGFPDLAACLADPLFAPLAADPELGAALAAPSPAPAPRPGRRPVADGIALVSGANTAWNPAAERLEPRFALPDDARRARCCRPPPRSPPGTSCASTPGAGAPPATTAISTTTATAGIPASTRRRIPQVTAVRYSEAARAADVDYGLNDSLLFDRVTFGNSSTALTGGPLWRSLPRYAMTRPDGTGPLRLWQNASANQLYVYPAHKDYGDGKEARSATSSPPTPPTSSSPTAPRAPTSPSSTRWR